MVAFSIGLLVIYNIIIYNIYIPFNYIIFFIYCQAKEKGGLL